MPIQEKTTGEPPIAQFLMQLLQINTSKVLDIKVYPKDIKLYIILNEPPYTERYVRWCERTLNKIIIQLLLDVRPAWAVARRWKSAVGLVVGTTS